MRVNRGTGGLAVFCGLTAFSATVSLTGPYADNMDFMLAALGGLFVGLTVFLGLLAILFALEPDEDEQQGQELKEATSSDPTDTTATGG